MDFLIYFESTLTGSTVCHEQLFRVKPKRTLVEDIKAKHTKGVERKETKPLQKRTKNPVYKKKVTPQAKSHGKGKNYGKGKK